MGTRVGVTRECFGATPHPDPVKPLSSEEEAPPGSDHSGHRGPCIQWEHVLGLRCVGGIQKLRTDLQRQCQIELPMMKGLFLASHFPDSEIDTEVKYLPKATQMTVPGFCPKDYGSRISPPPYGFLLVQVI